MTCQILEYPNPYTISCTKWILHHLKSYSSDLVNYVGLAFVLPSSTILNPFRFLQFTSFILAMYMLCCLRLSLALEMHRRLAALFPIKKDFGGQQ